MSSSIHLVLGDQLTHQLSSLRKFQAGKDVVLMVEVRAEGNYVPHHKQKIALILSAMRHFAAELQAAEGTVDYITLDDPENTHDLTGEVRRAINRHGIKNIIMTEPGEWRVLAMAEQWRDELGVSVTILPDDRFFCSRDEFAELTRHRITERMEFFYRRMRQRHNILMDGRSPVGGQWNFDPENRKRLPKGMQAPTLPRFEPNATTVAVLEMVEKFFPNHVGELSGFSWGVSRSDALKALDHFIKVALPDFGDYQDAMQDGADFLFHSALSPYLNLGLLTPREICARAEAAWQAGQVPLNSVEGFIRQILGWREFVRGVYWVEGPRYGDSNHLNAKRSLPSFYWSGETDLRCMAEAIRNTLQNAYAHHIQRLMVTGNFALITGISPREVQDWYLAVYADAYEWVELPNVHGMVLHADGGRIGSKPYAASGAYINRMSDHCSKCRYDPKIKTGPKACPLNYLYWNFLIDNTDRLAANPRMAMPYRNLGRMTESERSRIVSDAALFLEQMDGLPSWRSKTDKTVKSSTVKSNLEKTERNFEEQISMWDIIE